MSAHKPGPLYAVKIQDRSAYNIFAPDYATAIATVSSQTNAHRCMGSIVTRQYALAMAAGPELLGVLERAVEMCDWYAQFIRSDVMAADIERHPYLPELEGVAEDARAAIAKATGSAA